MIDLKSISDPIQQNQAWDDWEFFFFALRNVTALPDRLLQKRGLMRLHHRILFFAGRRPGLSVGDLLDVLQISKQALNVPLRQLFEMGYLDAATSVKDRRIKELRLTSSGQKLEKTLTGVQIRIFNKAFTQAGREAEQGWRAVMRSMAAM